MESCPELAWAQRFRLNELVGRLEDQLNRMGQPVSTAGTGTWVAALQAVAADPGQTREFLGCLGALVHHVRMYCPVRC